MNPLDQLLAIEEIKRLKAQYFRFMDTKDWEGLSQVFCEDAYFDARCAFSASLDEDTPAAQMCKDWVNRGSDQIVTFIRNGVEGFVSAHYGHGHEITVITTTQATGIIALEDYMYLQSEEGLKQVLHGRGHYHEEYRKEQGSWRIYSSRITRLFAEFHPPQA